MIFREGRLLDGAVNRGITIFKLGENQSCSIAVIKFRFVHNCMTLRGMIHLWKLSHKS